MTIKKQVILVFSIILGLLGIIVFTMAMVSFSNDKLSEAETHRFESVRLADQLRQSSDDLTRMVRTYAVTGDPIFEKYFYEILDIRDGKVPRPENYTGIYWDFVVATGERPTSHGPPAALMDLMKRTGLSDRELEKLKESKKNSDDLTNLEGIAFAAMKGLFTDDTGALTVKRDPDPALAREILHGKQYHEAKEAIMRPIAEFMELLDARTRMEVELVRREEAVYRNIAALLVAVTTVFSVFAFFHIRRRVIDPIVSLAGIAETIKSGNLTERAPVLSSDEIGALNSAFNSMIERTHAAIESLELENEERKRTELALLKAKEDADHANRAKSEFLSSMSHELRTPLNAILGFAQLLETSKKHPLNDHQNDQVQHIKSGGNRLLELIDDILGLIQIDTGKLSLSVETVDGRNLVDDCLNSSKTLAAKRGIVVEDRTGDAMPALRVDSLRSKQAVLNLLSNAVKYNREGGRIWLDAERPDHGILRIGVTDTGPGIPEDKQSSLFQPFNRLGAEVKAIEGTGVGLVLTKKLVKEMGVARHPIM